LFAAGTIFPPHFYHSVHCRGAVASDFILKAGKACTSVLANVIRIGTFGTATELIRRRIPVRDGIICWQEAGLCLAVIFERHGRNGNIAAGLVEGAFRKPGAAATTWSHDSHNLLVLGNSPEDMVIAQNQVIALQGGYVVAAEGAVAAEAPLQVGGIISDAPLEKLAKDLGRVRGMMAALGYENNNEIMSMSTLALPVSPAFKLTDYGLVDVKTQKKVALIAEECLDL
ncbi:MAG: adenine deaminase C-terminal domain-containing protein, partial [Lachnospiraceae bacterium]|nr:adenine deaminase C-terminal domain-containing protein [Lachnospiraceae bacterium]